MTEKNLILTYFNVSSDFYLFQITFEQNIYDWEEIPLDLGDPFLCPYFPISEAGNTKRTGNCRL